MEQAITYLNYIFTKFITFVFNTMVLDNGATYGWVIVAVLLFALLIRSILNIPRGISVKRGK